MSRIKWARPDLICPQQKGSVPGRNIFYATTLTCDLFRYTNLTGNSGVFLSLDQQNAFDRVSHTYLYSVLAAYGFPKDFIKLLKSLYSEVCSDLVTNGIIQDTIRVGRGVRQGCPLSPLIFVLTIDPFIRRLAGNGKIRGLPLPGVEVVRVFAYADDVSVFLKDSDSIGEVVRDFQCYSSLSGAKLNVDKSTVLPIGVGDIDLPSGFRQVSEA